VVDFITAFCSSSTNAKVKELSKTIHICQSYSNNERHFYGPVDHSVLAATMAEKIASTVTVAAVVDWLR